ncbi:hypothetical protein C6H64_03360 [Photorhabdus luminescens]|nr:hypothetical protein [Photorhabdus akhurstii]PQQ31390.1 hypothetical protein C6H69_15225 [Photorhabdus luminescens]PQQ32351.1 hypothetical protein C6H64_03360 [Photorhabdus luminescens]
MHRIFPFIFQSIERFTIDESLISIENEYWALHVLVTLSVLSLKISMQREYCSDLSAICNSAILNPEIKKNMRVEKKKFTNEDF